jgi:hypothetical protein
MPAVRPANPSVERRKWPAHFLFSGALTNPAANMKDSRILGASDRLMSVRHTSGLSPNLAGLFGEFPNDPQNEQQNSSGNGNGSDGNLIRARSIQH